ncbi:MAG: hypothetical protein PWP24_497 [Clostridiales bacterium]|nr:hypothetical protein [Clostridiales bacterium]
MANCVDYIRKQGKYGFDELPFHEVDSLLLCMLSYLKLEGMVPDASKRKKSVGLMEIFTHPLREKLFADERFEIPNRSMFTALAFSKRFQNTKINYLESCIDFNRQLQFAAMTFFLENGPTYVCFRGTDETIIGWKEDFNMAFERPIPSQILAVEYLNRVAKKWKGDFLVGGHSKGGNLAVYAAMECEEIHRQRIRAIYSNDGPGFMKEVIASSEFARVKDRIIKLVPQSSLIGMLLQNQEEYKVVASTGKGGVGQHDPYTWEIEGTDFVYKDEIHLGTRLFNERLNQWVEELDEKDRSIFVETLYQIVCSTQAETLMDLSEEWKDNALKMVAAFKEIDVDTRRALNKIIRALFHIRTKKSKK